MGQVSRLKIVILVFLVILFTAQDTYSQDTAQEDENLIITLPYGKLRGSDKGFYYSYESVPYAEPPVGELRFESPKPFAQQWETVFDATRPPALCLQLNYFGIVKGQEDCLTVNIHRPKQLNGTSLLPVFVYLHGGGFMFGSTADSEVDLMRSGRFVLVKIAYRLGALGFLSTEDEVLPGNYGLKDQRLALQWIKQNIVYFGGDKTKILLTGFSAGGASVHYHLLDPNTTEPIAKAAVSFSGTAFSPWALIPKSRSKAFKLAQNLKCAQSKTSADIKKCLKSMSAEDIVAEVKQFLVFGLYNPFTVFGPVVEPTSVHDAILTQQPEKVIKSGKFARIPWLLGYVAEDGAYNAAELLRRNSQGKELIDELNERWYEMAPVILFYKDSMSKLESYIYSWVLKQQYLGSQSFSIDSYLDVQRIYTDLLYKNGIQRAVELHKQFDSPVYAYKYDNPSDENSAQVLANRTDFVFGTTHNDDLTLILRFELFVGELREDQRLQSEKFIQMLDGFIQNDGELVYDNCQFVNNVGQKQKALMFITKDACQSKNLKKFP